MNLKARFVFGSALKVYCCVIEMTIRYEHWLIHEIKRWCAKNRVWHFVVSRMIYGISPHKYDIISGIFTKYP